MWEYTSGRLTEEAKTVDETESVHREATAAIILTYITRQYSVRLSFQNRIVLCTYYKLEPTEHYVCAIHN